MTKPSQQAAKRREALTEAARRLRREMTPSEARLWERLRDNRLRELHFRRQERIGPFVVDFCCRRARLVVEVDGEVHQNQTEKDAARELWLAAEGWLMLRFGNDEVEDTLENVLRVLGQTALRRLNRR